MEVIVADSDVLIDALNGIEPSASRIARELKQASLATTAVNAFELLSGARRPGQLEKITDLLDGINVLGLDSSASFKAAELRRELEGQGFSIGMADYLIAGVCITRSFPLLTRNRRHFERVDDLSLVALD